MDKVDYTRHENNTDQVVPDDKKTAELLKPARQKILSRQIFIDLFINRSHVESSLDPSHLNQER